MARIYPLFSSSSGNASFIGTPQGGVLIDAGVSMRRLSMAFSRCGLDLSAVRAVMITHEHSDHVKGLKLLTKQYQIPVYGQGKTLRNLIDSGQIHAGSAVYEMTAPVAVAGMEITAFDTPHDTPQSCGYRIHTSDDRYCAVCTDLGKITPTVAQALTGCDLVLLEANYDPDMLSNGKYPYQVRCRIASDYGHLSNQACAVTAAELVAGGTTRILLGHLSPENNTPECAEQTVAAALSGFRRDCDYLLSVAPVETDGRMVVF